MAEKQFTEMVWREGMTFDATTTTGHHLVIDALPPAGNDKGPKPIELLLTALAGCTAMDVLSILQKMREPLTGLKVRVEGARCVEHPMIYTDIQVVYYVQGSVNPAAVQRAIELSETKYCGVAAMLREKARISSRFEIEPGMRHANGNGHVAEPEHVAEALP